MLCYCHICSLRISLYYYVRVLPLHTDSFEQKLIIYRLIGKQSVFPPHFSPELFISILIFSFVKIDLSIYDRTIAF